MSSFVHTEDSEMNQHVTDVDSYRKLVLQLFSLRRYKSALFWAEKVTVLSNNDPKDVYQLAQCMFMLKEYNRAAHVIKMNKLEQSNLLCLTLLVECLYDSKEYQEALNLLSFIEIEDLNTSLHNDTTENEQMALNTEPNKSVSQSPFQAGFRSMFFFSGCLVVALFAES